MKMDSLDEVYAISALRSVSVVFFLCTLRRTGGVFWPRVLPLQKVWLTDGASIYRASRRTESGNLQFCCPSRPDSQPSCVSFGTLSQNPFSVQLDCGQNSI